MKFTLTQFNERFPSEEACISEIWELKYGSDHECERCYRYDSYHRIQGRMSFQCKCGLQLYPLAGTIFEKTRTPLMKWFYLIYRMSSSKASVSAKQMQFELGVTYKTSWAMMHKVRSLMEDNTQLEGDIEVDETYMKAKPQRDSRVPDGRKAFFDSPMLVGAIERGGRVKVWEARGIHSWNMRDWLVKNVERGSTIHTDGSQLYKLVERHFVHSSRVHWGQRVKNKSQYVFLPQSGDSTQQIENFWFHVKRSIRGAHIHVSRQHLQKYANEIAFRYSNRNSTVPIFDIILYRI